MIGGGTAEGVAVLGFEKLAIEGGAKALEEPAVSDGLVEGGPAGAGATLAADTLWLALTEGVDKGVAL